MPPTNVAFREWNIRQERYKHYASIMHDPKFQDWFLEMEHNQIDDDGVKRLISLLTKASYETALQENEINNMTQAFLQSRHSKPPQGPHSQPHKQHHQQMRLPDPARPPQGPNSQPHQQYHQQHHQAAPQGPRKQMWRPDPARPDIVDSDGRWWYKHTHGGFKQYDDWYKTRGEDHLETTLDDNATAYDVPLDLTA